MRLATSALLLLPLAASAQAPTQCELIRSRVFPPGISTPPGHDQVDFRFRAPPFARAGDRDLYEVCFNMIIEDIERCADSSKVGWAERIVRIERGLQFEVYAKHKASDTHSDCFIAIADPNLTQRRIWDANADNGSDPPGRWIVGAPSTKPTRDYLEWKRNNLRSGRLP